MANSKFISTAALGALGIALLGAAPAQAGDSAAADANAVIIASHQLTNVDPLQFGRIVPTGLGGAVTINASNGAVTTIGQVSTVGSNQTRARFTVKAPIGTVMILSGDPSVVLTRNGGAETMTAALVHRGGSGLIPVSVFFLPIGLQATLADQEIFTGGTLNVAGNQMVGTYEGTFDLIVAYL